MEKFEVVRKGWKQETVVSEFDCAEKARAFREQQPSNKNLYVRPVNKRGTEQYDTRLPNLKRKVKKQRGTKRVLKYFLIDYEALKLVGEYGTEDKALKGRKGAGIDGRLVTSAEDIESTFTFDQRVDLYRNLGGTSKVLQRGQLHHMIFKLLNKEYDMATVKKTTTKSKATKKATAKKGKAVKKAVKGKASKKAAKGNGVVRKGSCAKVYEVCENLYAKDPEAPRASYISACLKAGIKKSTASTIYQRWKVANFG